MMNDLKLTPFETSDFKTLIDWLDGRDAAFLIQLSGPRYSFPLNKEQLLQSYNDESIESFKLSLDKTMVGHIQLLKYNEGERSASIGAVMVSPHHQKRGIAQEMLRQIMSYAKKHKKVQTLYLRVFDFNSAAIACYSKVGFQESTREDVYFPSIAQTWNCITMKKDL